MPRQPRECSVCNERGMWRGNTCRSSQLTLLEPVVPVNQSVPLRVALEQLAEAWSLRIGEERVVTGNSWVGWIIGPPRA